MGITELWMICYLLLQNLQFEIGQCSGRQFAFIGLVEDPIIKYDLMKQKLRSRVVLMKTISWNQIVMEINIVVFLNRLITVFVL